MPLRAWQAWKVCNIRLQGFLENGQKWLKVLILLHFFRFWVDWVFCGIDDLVVAASYRWLPGAQNGLL